MSRDLFTEPHAHHTQPNEPQGAAAAPGTPGDTTRHWTPEHRARVEALQAWAREHGYGRPRMTHPFFTERQP